MVVNKLNWRSAAGTGKRENHIVFEERQGRSVHAYFLSGRTGNCCWEEKTAQNSRAGTGDLRDLTEKSIVFWGPRGKGRTVSAF